MKRFLILTTLLAVTSCSAGENKNLTKEVTLPNGIKGVLRKEGETSKKIEEYTLKFKSGLGERKVVKVYKMDDIYLIPSFQIKNGKLITINPKVEKVSVDISFLREIDKKFKEMNINNISGKRGGKIVYFIFDAYCPYCIADFKKYYKELKDKYEVHFIPFAVHGNRSVKVMACMFNDMKRLPADKVLETYFSKENYLELLSHCNAKETEKLIREISSILRKNFIKATPTFIYQDSKGKFKVKVGVPTPLITSSKPTNPS